MDGKTDIDTDRRKEIRMDGWMDRDIKVSLMGFDPVVSRHMRCTQLRATHFGRQNLTWKNRQRHRHISLNGIHWVMNYMY